MNNKGKYAFDGSNITHQMRVKKLAWIAIISITVIIVLAILFKTGAAYW